MQSSIYNIGDFIKHLKQYRHTIDRQTFKTIRGQALAGDIEGATKGLHKVLNKPQSGQERLTNAHRNTRHMIKTHGGDYKGQFNISLAQNKR